MDRMFARLGPKAALGADGSQWILYRGFQPKPDEPGQWQGLNWRGISFVRLTKAILVRCIREKGLELSAEGKSALDALPDSFDAWKADPAMKGSPIAPEALLPLTDAPTELPEPGEGGRERLTYIERLGPQCAIATDGRQWIVLRAGGAAREGRSDAWRGQSWDAVGFIANSKRALLQCLEDKGLKLSAAGKAALARQDDKLWRWQRAPVDA